MTQLHAQTTRRAAPLSIPECLRLDRAADRARAEHERRERTVALHKARAEKQILQELALRIDRDHAAWLAAGSPEHGEVA